MHHLHLLLTLSLLVLLPLQRDPNRPGAEVPGGDLHRGGGVLDVRDLDVSGGFPVVLEELLVVFAVLEVGERLFLLVERTNFKEGEICLAHLDLDLVLAARVQVLDLELSMLFHVLPQSTQPVFVFITLKIGERGFIEFDFSIMKFTRATIAKYHDPGTI